MNKPFTKLYNREKDENISLSKNTIKGKDSQKSKALIISGFIISLSSIFFLLFTINNKFG